VHKRQSFLISACILLTVLALVVPSFFARLVLAGLLLITVVAVVLTNRKSANSSPSDRIDQTNAPENLAISSLLEATLTGMREGLLVVNKDMRVVASNPAAHKLFNPSVAALKSQRLTELTRNPAIYSAFLDGLKGIERSGVKVETHGPERQVFDLRVIPIGSANGHGAQGALGVFFDITRTERLEIVRQEFLSNVSHELRTPLTAIIAFVETLETGAMEDPESSQRFLSIIRKNASRMHSLIDDILELTAIEGGNVTLRAAPVELYTLVEEVCASLAAKAAAQNVTLKNSVPPEVMVYADERRLEQMLTNLIDNGIKFSREHGTVAISYESGTRDRILVQDNGDGIPAQHLERLFERFYRVDRARSRDIGGTGLGLAIVKHLALLHGGEVTVASELGKGTTFTIHLPKRVF
jgi:two-component system, OmpR family, phosphate regulon sensor histidine kinase PhoR